MSRAPNGFITLKDGTILRTAKAVGLRTCAYSGRRVTDTQRRRGTVDCPLCGAPDLVWVVPAGADFVEVGKTARYLNHATWPKHQPGIGSLTTLPGLDSEEFVWEDRGVPFNTDTKEDDTNAPF